MDARVRQPQPDERPIGEVVSRLVEDGKAYARAELNVARTQLDVRMVRIRAVALWGALALLFAIGALIALSLTAVLFLASLIGPLAGGLAATLLMGAVAGLFAFLDKKRWERGDE